MSVIGSVAGRVGLAAAAAAAAMSLASCGPPDLNAMNTAYDNVLTSTCVSTASTNNPAAAAQAYCGCVTAQLDQIPIQQRIKLTPSSNEVSAAMSTCQAQVASSAASAATNAAAIAPSSAPDQGSSGSSSSGQSSSSSGN